MNAMPMEGHASLLCCLLCLCPSLSQESTPVPVCHEPCSFQPCHSLQDAVHVKVQKQTQKILEPFLDLCVSSLREGHANLLCIVPILTDVTEVTSDLPDFWLYIHKHSMAVASMGCKTTCIGDKRLACSPPAGPRTFDLMSSPSICS